MHDKLLGRYAKFVNLMSGEMGKDRAEYRWMGPLVVLVMIRSISLIVIAVLHFSARAGAL